MCSGPLISPERLCCPKTCRPHCSGQARLCCIPSPAGHGLGCARRAETPQNRPLLSDHGAGATFHSASSTAQSGGKARQAFSQAKAFLSGLLRFCNTTKTLTHVPVKARSMADRTLHSSIPHFSLQRQFIVKAFSELSVIFPMKLPSTAGNFHKKCLYGYCVIRALWVLYRQTHAPATHDENGKRKPSRPCTRRNTILNLSVQQKRSGSSENP